MEHTDGFFLYTIQTAGWFFYYSSVDRYEWYCCCGGVGSGSEVVEVQDKKRNVADILSRNVNAFQQLSVYVEPVLGR